MPINLSIAILAGGLATRLRPVTEKIPKSLIEINSEPFIAHQLRLLQRQGFHHVVICIGYLGEQIIDFVDDGSQFGLSVDYASDGDKLLGTAGCIKHALPLLTDNFFVLYGDSYLPCDYSKVLNSFVQQKKLGLMTVCQNEQKWDPSNVEFVNGQILIYDKHQKTERMQHIDFGLSILNKKSFDIVPDNETLDLGLLYQILLEKNQLAGFEVKERSYEVASFDGNEELGNHLAEECLT